MSLHVSLHEQVCSETLRLELRCTKVIFQKTFLQLTAGHQVFVFWVSPQKLNFEVSVLFCQSIDIRVKSIDPHRKGLSEFVSHIEPPLGRWRVAFDLHFQKSSPLPFELKASSVRPLSPVVRQTQFTEEQSSLIKPERLSHFGKTYNEETITAVKKRFFQNNRDLVKEKKKWRQSDSSHSLQTKPLKEENDSTWKFCRTFSPPPNFFSKSKYLFKNILNRSKELFVRGSPGFPERDSSKENRPRTSLLSMTKVTSHHRIRYDLSPKKSDFSRVNYQTLSPPEKRKALDHGSTKASPKTSNDMGLTIELFKTVKLRYFENCLRQIETCSNLKTSHNPKRKVINIQNKGKPQVKTSFIFDDLMYLRAHLVNTEDQIILAKNRIQSLRIQEHSESKYCQYSFPKLKGLK